MTQRTVSIPRSSPPIRVRTRPTLWRNRPAPRFSGGAIRLCHIASVPVELHTSCLVYPIGFLLWIAFTSDVPRDLRGGRIEFALLLEGFLALLWACLLVHEFAHVLVARRFGTSTERVVILPIGAAALMREPMRDSRELWIALAGPAASFALAGLFALALHWFPGRTGLPMFLKAGCAINLALALFNLLPCFPMDGGRVLRSLLAIVIACFSRIGRRHAFGVATHIVVRVVNPIIATGAIAFTIFQSHAWMHLVLFPLMLVAGEIELRVERANRLGLD